MMRRSRGALGQLLRLQAARERGKPDDSARDTADAVEPAAARQIADALGCAPPAPQHAPEGRSLAKAGEYALASAALIPSLGRLSKKFDDGIASPELVHEIVNDDSRILQALAKKSRNTASAPRPEQAGVVSRKCRRRLASLRSASPVASGTMEDYSTADAPSAADRPQPNQSKDRADVSGRRYWAGSANSKGNRK